MLDYFRLQDIPLSDRRQSRNLSAQAWCGAALLSSHLASSGSGPPSALCRGETAALIGRALTTPACDWSASPPPWPLIVQDWLGLSLNQAAGSTAAPSPLAAHS